MKKFYLLLMLACAYTSSYAQQPCNMIVDFISDTSVSSPGTINFTNLSTPLEPTDSIIWYFGDGNSSSQTNPSYTYRSGGIYRVCLQVSKTTATSSCVSEYCREIYVTPDCNFTPDFSFMRDSSSNSFTFINTAPYNSIDSSFWDFGDGSPLQYSPYSYTSHLFPSTGTFTVCLIIKRKIPGSTVVLCTRQVCKPVTVNTVTCNTTASFSFTTDAANVQQIHFTNGTPFFAGRDSIYWTFGNGYYSSEANPVHTYNNGGTFTVCLRVITNDPANGGECISNYCKDITVPYACNEGTAFYWSANDTLPGVNLVYFYNASYPFNSFDSCLWDFGDGSPLEYNNGRVEHQYAATGNYNVCLTIKKMLPDMLTVICTRQVCQTVTVQNPPACNLQASFTNRVYIPGNNNLQLYFVSTSADIPGTTYAWDFGDGIPDTGSVLLHQYTQPGSYNVCLTISAGINCSSSYCSVVNVLPNNPPPCDTNTVSFSFNRDYYLPNKVYLFVNTFSPYYNQSWQFKKVNSTDVAVSSTYTPYYLFADTGLYSVCCTVVFWNGCEKTFCDTIAINSITAPSYCYLLAFPNPASNTASVNVQLEQAGQITSTIFSLQGVAVGQLVQQGVAGNNLVSLNVASLPTGFYSVQINYGNKVCYSRFQK